MNQPQREFLIKHIEKAHQKHERGLNERKPKPPSLNNYLIAAILEGSFKLQTKASLRAFIRETVLALGPDGRLVKKKERYDTENWAHLITLDAEALFVMPAEYDAAREAYEREREAWDAEVNQAEAVKDTLILKVQIGSAEVLKRLVEQVDNMADLQLVNNRLLLTEGGK